MGLPVIATRVGGSVDQVVEGVTGLLVPPGDPEALAEAIGKLMQDPEWRRRMSRAATDRIREHFSLTEMTRNIERLIDQTTESTGVTTVPRPLMLNTSSTGIRNG